MSDLCTVKKSTLDGIAEAIQSKTGESGRMLPSEMAGKIEDLPSQPAKGLVFSDYDSDGYPTKAEFVGSWTSIPQTFCNGVFNISNFGKNVTSIVVPSGVSTLNNGVFKSCSALRNCTISNTVHTIGNEVFQYSGINNFVFESGNMGLTIGTRCFGSNTVITSITFPSFISLAASNTSNICESCTNLVSVTFEGNPFNINNNMFGSCNKVELYDFSHATSIPTLYSTASLGHKSGCVIRIPLALSDQTIGTGNGWESATNWSALTNVTWEAV